MSENVSDSNPAAQGKPEKFGKLVLARMTPAERKALAQTRWLDRLTSLWAPVTIFGVVFGIYLTIVESSVCTYLWLQLPLKIFGLLMFIAWVALVVSRVAARRFTAERKTRGAYEELLTEVESLTDKKRSLLQQKAVDDLSDGALALARAIGARDPAGQQKAGKDLSQAIDKHLVKWRGGGAGDFAGGFVKALAVALLIRTVLVEPFKIPSGSLIPTLEIGDQIFVNKFIYGVRIPFVDKVPFQLIRAPKRGDIVVFFNRLVGKDFIKRVVAVPGDRLKLSGSTIEVNGQALPTVVEAQEYTFWEQPVFEGGVGDYLSYSFRNDWSEHQGTLFRETIDGRPHLMLHNFQPRQPEIDVVVPEKSVFVMGDNRDNSDDSRYGLGSGSGRVEFVPYDSIKGKATVIWLSLSHGGLFSSVFGGTGLRTDRFFAPVTMCGSEPPRQ